MEKTTELTFDFGGYHAGAAVHINTETLYTPGGAGFVTEKNRAEQPGLAVTEACGNFQPWYWLDGVSLGILCDTPSGIRLDRRESIPECAARALPLIFKTDVPENGNYSVNILIQSPITQNISVFVGRRRLAFLGRVSAGQSLELHCIEAVMPMIPRGQTEVLDRPALEVSVMAAVPTLARIEIRPADCATLWIGGDSTVTDQSANYPYLPGTSYAGWGQMLSSFLADGFAVSNHAESGLTTNSFREQGYWAIARARIRPGDVCLFQFGHNDQKLPELTAQGGYRENLLRFVEEVREKQAIPVLVTPLARNSWRGGSEYNDLLADYAAVCIELGRERNVPVVLLHEYSMTLIKRLGLESAKAYFYPGDYTHTNDYGARTMAAFVAAQLQKLLPDGMLYTANSGRPAEQPPKYMLGVPKAPAGYKGKAPDAAGPFEAVARPDAVLNRAEAMKMANDTVHIFQTNVYNDHFEDVVGHEWYAGTVEAALDFGLIPAAWRGENRIYPDRAVTRGEFLTMLLLGLRVRRSWPAEALAQPEEGAQAICAAKAVGLCREGDALDLPLTRGEAAALCKQAEPMQ